MLRFFGKFEKSAQFAILALYKQTNSIVPSLASLPFFVISLRPSAVCGCKKAKNFTYKVCMKKMVTFVTQIRTRIKSLLLFQLENYVFRFLSLCLGLCLSYPSCN